jgi:hypothetical protein
MDANTTPVGWSAAARTWRAGRLRVREPRMVLPSNAIACREPGSDGGVRLVIRVASHLPMVAASRSGSMACSSLRIIVSDGRRSGSIPSRIAVSAGKSATHSPIAVWER